MTAIARPEPDRSQRAALQAEAEALGLATEGLSDAAIRQAISREKERRWLEENAEAIKGFNDWVERNGLPLAKYRQF